jgi:hypothetical protein
MEELFKSVNYESDTDYIVSAYIREYDISQANINVLRNANIVSNEEFAFLSSLPKHDREVNIGRKMTHNKTLYEIIRAGIEEARGELFKANRISDSDVLIIANDAVFTVNKPLKHTITSKGLEFRLKNTYNSYYRIRGHNDMSFLYWLDGISGNEIMTVRGMRQSNLVKHERHFSEFLKTVFCSIQTDRITDTLVTVREFYNAYVSRLLDIGYYRSFDSDSAFLFSGTNYMSDHEPDTEYMGDLDISINAHMIREIYRLVVMIA